MNKTRFLITAIALPMTLSQVNIAFSAPNWMNAKDIPQAFMAAEDSNGDGKVSKAEFKGHDNAFAQFDKNNDGVIELSEAPKTAPMGEDPAMDPYLNMLDEVTINGVNFKLTEQYAFFGWNELPTGFKYEKQPVKQFTGANGQTHYYQVVYLPEGNLNWFQAAYLAEDAGGYLVSLTSEQENDFVFNMVNDPKYFWAFPKYVEGKSAHDHHEITIGPFLGGYQIDGSVEPAGGWQWLSGETWDYTNWAVNLDDGVIDKDPRPNDQPNDSGDSQRVMGFGEMNLPVPTWGDYMDSVGTYGKSRLPGRSYAFIIEFNEAP